VKLQQVKIEWGVSGGREREIGQKINGVRDRALDRNGNGESETAVCENGHLNIFIKANQ
jgi:hypothetical protein